MSDLPNPKKLAKSVILGAIEDVEHLTVTEMTYDAIEDPMSFSEKEIDDLIDQVQELVDNATVKVKVRFASED